MYTLINHHRQKIDHGGTSFPDIRNEILSITSVEDAEKEAEWFLSRLKTANADTLACAKLLLMSCYCYLYLPGTQKSEMSTYTGIACMVSSVKPTETASFLSPLGSLMRKLPYNNPAYTFFCLFNECCDEIKQKAVMHIMSVLGSVLAVHRAGSKDNEDTNQVFPN